MIKILKAVYSILYNDTDVSNIVGNKIFPNVVPDKDSTAENIDYPLIVTRRTELLTEYSKDCHSDSASVEIICYSVSYTDSVELAEKVRNALEYFTGTVEGILISRARLSGISEDYTDGIYYQQLLFDIK